MSMNVGLRALAVLISVVLVTSAVPMLMPSASPVEDASAQDELIVKVGWMQKFMNWNPLDIAFVSDYVAIFLVYDSLFQYSENMSEIENHLAVDTPRQEIGPSGNMSTWINISKNAYFRNAEAPDDKSHPLTAEDVKFTIDFILDHPGGSWDYYVMNITGVNVTAPYEVKIDTAFPKATLFDDFVWVPILPKFWWEDPKNVNPNNVLANLAPMDMMGSGPFYLADYDHNQWYTFLAAPNYHATADYGEERDLDFDGITYTIYSNIEGLRLAIEGDELDVVDVTGAQTQTWNDLGATKPYIIKQVTTEPGIYDICINNIPLEFRTEKYGNGNPILLDDVVRKALGMTIDRYTLSEEYFDGRATVADTVLNPGFWHPDLENYVNPEGYTPPSDSPRPLPFSPAWALENLTAAGYADTNSDGILEVTDTTAAHTQFNVEVGEPLEFRLRVPDSDPGYADVGQAWVGWAEDAGIKLNFEVVQEGIITNFDWYQADFDMWVWSWYWGAEPLSNLAVWRTSEVTVGGDNCAGPITDDWYWVDEENGVARCTYDDVFDEALRTIDVNERKALVDLLQVMIYDSHTEFPPIHPNGLYAMSTANFVGWGDWSENLMLTIISDMLWLWYNLEPASDNMNPVFDTPLNPTYEVEVDEPWTFSVGVHDPEGDPITVTWVWGDETPDATNVLDTGTEEEQTVQQTHTYADEDTYTLQVFIIDDEHTVPRGDSAQVIVVPEPNLGPTIGEVTPDLEVAYIDEEVTWTATAMDSEQGVEGTGLRFTWDWDDGTKDVEDIYPVENDTYVSSVQTHAWSEAGKYTVTVFVWDGYGDDQIVTIHNVSADIPYEVVDNYPPVIHNVSSISGLVDVAVPCVVTVSDLDGDSLRITWEWDDGTYTVTTVDTSDEPGVPIRSVVEHTWDADGTYPVTVYVDDLYGASLSNASESLDAVIVAPPDNAPPGSISLVAAPCPAYVGDEITLNVSAYDADGDALTVTIQFGDDNEEVATIAAGSTDLQYVEFLHTYTSERVYKVNVSVDDDTDNVTKQFDLEVLAPEENKAPVLILQSSYSLYLGVEKSIKPVDLYDPNGDPITVWYDWDDGSPLTKGGDEADGYAASHTYFTAGDFTLTVYADDGQGHNTTEEAPLNVQEANRRPAVVSVVKSPSKSSYEIGEEITFSVTLRDKEGDDVELIIDFGDGTNETMDITDLVPATNKTVTFTHAYEEVGEYTVVATAKDGQLHADPTWLTSSTNLKVAKEGGISMLAIAGIVLALVAAAAVVLLLMRRKKKGPAEEAGGMEGMAPPEAPEQGPPPPPETGGSSS